MLPLGLGNVKNEADFHEWLTLAVFALAVITVVATFNIVAPYGRHLRPGWGPTWPDRIGWIIMESPSAVWFLAVFLYGEHKYSTTPLIAASLWLTHYIYRSYIYPFLIRSNKNKRMPVTVALCGVFYNMINAYVNARHLSHFGDYSNDNPFERVSFYMGVTLFLVGFFINIQSDQILINLRKPGETSGYKIPYGGMFKFVSAPNYFGEILEWTGWSLVAWSLPGVSFAVYTAANLIPRAITNHQWYLDKFKESYPKARRAVIPRIL